MGLFSKPAAPHWDWVPGTRLQTSVDHGIKKRQTGTLQRCPAEKTVLFSPAKQCSLEHFEGAGYARLVQAPTLETLRRQLREKFPQAHVPCTREAVEAEPVHLLTPAAFPAGAISEVVCAGPVSGLGLWVAGLLAEPEGQISPASPELVWIDGADSFDPESFGQAACSRLLWVRCRAAVEMLKAADLLARDGNVPFLLLDASGLPRKDLAAFPASAWWRLKQTIETNKTRLVLLTSFPIIPCATARWSLSTDFSLSDFDRPSRDLQQRVRVVTERLQRVN